MDPRYLITAANARARARALRRSFPHMGPADCVIWDAVLRMGLVKADRFEYDVKLGGKLTLRIADTMVLKPMWESLLKKRIDVVAWNGTRPSLVEVKPVGSFAALGQCLGYGYLWKKERPTDGPVSLICACAVCDPDLIPVFALYGVDVVSLPERKAEEVLLQLQSLNWTGG